jgi:surface antigen
VIFPQPASAQDWIWFSDQSIRPAAATYLCIDVYHSNWHDGTPIHLFNCNGTNAQTWGPPGGYSTNAPPPPGSHGGGSDGATWGIAWEQKGVNYNPFPVCQCTWGMEQKVHDYTSGHRLNGDWGVYPYVTGNAMDWANQALAAGWTVDDWSHPQVNSIVVLQPYVGGAFDLGHVGWVTAVNTVKNTIDMIIDQLGRIVVRLRQRDNPDPTGNELYPDPRTERSGPTNRQPRPCKLEP